MDVVPHLAWPLRYSSNGYVTVQQDTVEELAVTVGVICSFPLGYREDAPEFGIEDPEFSSWPLNLADVDSAISVYEPRASVEIVQEPYDPRNPGAARVRIKVSMPGGEDETSIVELEG